MASSPQMYDNGLDHLKKAALTVKVRSFLNANGDIDPTDLENPELSLDLQSLIDDPNFEVGDNLFPELLHEKLMQAPSGNKIINMNGEPFSQLAARINGHNNHIGQNGHNGQNGQHNGNGQHFLQSRNPLAYMPQPVHGGSSFNPNNNNITSSSNHNNGNNENGILVKQEPSDLHRLDFNGNAVSSSDLGSAGSQGSGSSGSGSYGSYSNPLSNVTSPSSSSTNSQGYSPNAYIQHHHLTPTTIPGSGDGLIVTAKNGGGLNFNGKGLHHGHGGHHGHGHSHGHGHHHSSKKLKNVDKASDEYKRRRERNNIAVRKSREKAKIRSRETEERVKILAKENERLQKKIELLSEELTFLRSFFSNVGGLPEQIHREFNKHLETFQHHHVQNGIQFNGPWDKVRH